MNPGKVLLAVMLLVANGFFVAAEFSLLASRRSRIEQLAASGDRRARRALAGIRELPFMLAAAQLGITMASLGLGAVAEPTLAAGFLQLLGRLEAGVRRGVAFGLALLIVVFGHLLLGELAPKSWAIGAPEQSALLLAGPFRAFALMFQPAIRVLNAIANRVVRFCGVTPQGELAVAHSPTDLILLLEESAEHGTLEAEQTALLARALELPDLDAQAVMVPRRDVVCVPATASVTELERIAAETGHSRLPVHRGDLDRFIGILHVKDLLGLSSDERTRITAQALARPALVTPESRPLTDLMLDMREQRQHVALVVDEYGSVSGLVALEDVIEELIGEFEDESDRPRQEQGPQFPHRADGAILVPGTLRPDELEAQTGLSLPEGEYETVAGFVISALGRLPAVGDTVGFANSRLEVTRVERHRLVELAIHR
jgi:CBS domain containing-hemolysin-like protein